MRELPPRPSPELLKEIAWHQEQARKFATSAVSMLYEFDREDAMSYDCQYALLCRSVYEAVGREMACQPFRVSFIRLIKQTCEDLGAVYYTYCGHAMFRGMRKRDICPAQSREETKRVRGDARYAGRYKPGILGFVEKAPRQSTLMGTWEKLLRGEGMPSELDATLPVDMQRSEINAARIDKAMEAYWRAARDAMILKCYTEGLSIIATAERLKLGRKLVWNRLKHYDLSTTGKGSKDGQADKG